MKRKQLWMYAAVMLPALLVLAAFEILPALRLLASSFSGREGGFTLEHYEKALFSKFYLQSLQNSLSLSVFSTLLGLLIGTLAAYAMFRSGKRAHKWMTTFVSITVNFAGVPLAFAFIVIMGSNGMVTILFAKLFGLDLYGAGFTLYGIVGLSLAYVYFQIPLATLLMVPAFYGIKREWEEAAFILGAKPAQFWRRVGIPVIAPALAGTFGILFANAIGAYATAYALTTGIFNILPLRLSRLIAGEVSYEPELASAVAMVLAVIMIAGIWLNRMMLNRYRGGRG
ncbi:ABC transporter permease [Brevibacillus sp. B_LB10_24]|uniref:ABC transporter permease n=1 Tax=Brevibacillus TaxID=55080 RepID=UPI00030E19CA|nr:ABC transporter permease subunit [Brevibacillus massiliensis]